MKNFTLPKLERYIMTHNGLYVQVKIADGTKHYFLNSDVNKAYIFRRGECPIEITATFLGEEITFVPTIEKL